ncbi:hypothetical protein ACIHFD_49235 [Nonomuraea sp. NPDC051941]|uniref:hypothetical protein n=1 Tax=Nonomuraea sp. NPDC051941 TaxID=3364373 RepID=UPI0037C98435
MTSTTIEAPAPAAKWRPEGMRTRQPTGKKSWPLILVEGPEYSRKTWHAARLSGSPRVGESFFLDFNEGHSDEYGRVPGARYEILEHDGSYTSIMRQIENVRQVAEHAVANGEKPVLLIIDSMAAIWRLLSMWASNRARGSKVNRKRLAEDPDADIEVTRNYWNDANDRHAALVAALRRIPGIVVMTGRGKWVSGTDAFGQPTKEKEYTLETQKQLGYSSSAWLRLSRDAQPQVIGLRDADPAKSIIATVDDPQPILKKDWDLEWFIFEVMELDPANTALPNLIQPKPDRTPEQFREEALNPETSWARLRELYEESRAFHGVLITNENRAEEALGTFISKLAQARATSDPEVVAQLALDMAAASTPNELAQVGQAIATAVGLGQVSEKDRKELHAEYQNRMKELRATQRQAAAQAKQQQTQTPPEQSAPEAQPDQEAGT